MQIEIDLKIIENKLGREHAQAKGLIKQIRGIYAIRRDLFDARSTLRLFWEWHSDAVKPARTPSGDNGTEAVIGRALFSLAIMRTCRAVDMASEGRQKVDFRPAFKAEGLEAILDEMIEFRNQELAHYGGLERPRGQFSDDRAVLVIKDDGDAGIAIAWRRGNSERDIAVKLASIVDCAMSFSDKYKQNKHDLFLSLLASDVDLKSHIKSLLPEALFIQSEFFAAGYPIRDIQPDGPVLKVQW